MRKLLVYSCNILVVVPKHLNITLISLGLAVWLQYWPIGHSPFFWYLTLCVVLSIIEWVQTYIYERVVVHHHLYPYSPCSSLINDLYILCRLFSLPSSPNLCHLFLLMITYASHTKEWSMLEKHSYIACIPPPTEEFPIQNLMLVPDRWTHQRALSCTILQAGRYGNTPWTLLTGTNGLWSGHVVRSTDAVRPRACNSCVYDLTKGNTIRITNPTLFFARKLASCPFSTGRFCTCSNLDKQMVSVSGLFRVKSCHFSHSHTVFHVIMMRRRWMLERPIISSGIHLE